MAKFIDVIVTIDGFQHGEDEFTLKAMAVVASAVSFQWSNLYQSGSRQGSSKLVLCRDCPPAIRVRNSKKNQKQKKKHPYMFTSQGP